MKKLLSFNSYIKEEYRKGSDKFSGLIHDIMLFLRNFEDLGNEITIPLSDFLSNVKTDIDELKKFQETTGLVNFKIKFDNDNITFYDLDKSSKQRHVWEKIQEKLLPKELRTSNLLFHATSWNLLLNILKQNKLYGSDFYDFGVATSRNRYYLHKFSEYSGDLEPGTADCQLILDRDKIKEKYKIKAFDWEEYKRNPEQKYHQSEDKILTDIISPIDKYIVGIQFNNLSDDFIKKLMNSELWNNDWIAFDKDWNIISV